MNLGSADSDEWKLSGGVYMQVPLQWYGTLRVPAQQWTGSHNEEATRTAAGSL